MPKEARVKRNSNWITIKANQIVPGDIIKIETNDTVPADIVLFSTNNLKVCNQLINGTSAIQSRSAEKS